MSQKCVTALCGPSRPTHTSHAACEDGRVCTEICNIHKSKVHKRQVRKLMNSSLPILDHIHSCLFLCCQNHLWMMRQCVRHSARTFGLFCLFPPAHSVSLRRPGKSQNGFGPKGTRRNMSNTACHAMACLIARHCQKEWSR